SGYGALGIIFGVLLFGGIWWCVIGVRERDLTEIKRPHGSPWQNLRHALSNRPFMTLLAAYSIWSLGAALSATIFLFFFEHVLQSTAGPFVLVVYLVTGIVFMPFWVYASRRFEKRPAWIAAVTVSAVSISGLALLGPGDVVVASVMLALAGTGLGGAIAIPPSMQADVIDYDELKSGERREGQYIGLWALAKKLGMATSAGLALPALDWSGYLGGQIVQPEDTVTALKWLFVGGPVICNALAVSIALTYTIDRREHQAMRAEIDATTDMQSST
ncbi:MAG: MFS transporter, partial [Gemmatimonadales bacterium]